MKQINSAIGEGYKQSKTQSELGGLFLMDDNCDILWQHLESFAGDHGKNDEIYWLVKLL